MEFFKWGKIPTGLAGVLVEERLQDIVPGEYQRKKLIKPYEALINKIV